MIKKIHLAEIEDNNLIILYDDTTMTVKEIIIPIKNDDFNEGLIKQINNSENNYYIDLITYKIMLK